MVSVSYISGEIREKILVLNALYVLSFTTPGRYISGKLIGSSSWFFSLLLIISINYSYFWRYSVDSYLIIWVKTFKRLKTVSFLNVQDKKHFNKILEFYYYLGQTSDSFSCLFLLLSLCIVIPSECIGG